MFCLVSPLSVFNNTDKPWDVQLSESEDLRCRNNDLPFVDMEIVRGQLYQPNFHKSMRPDGIHPRALKELADVAVGLPSMTYQRSLEVPGDWKLANTTQIHKKGMREDQENYRPVSLTSIPGKITEKIILSAPEWHLKDNANIRHSQHGFTKGKSCLTSYPSTIRTPV